VSDIRKTRKDSHVVYPSGKPRIPHLLCCQGIGVNYYSLTLDALHLRHPQLLQRQGFERACPSQKRVLRSFRPSDRDEICWLQDIIADKIRIRELYSCINNMEKGSKKQQ
jgi:hypothetical protein